MCSAAAVRASGEPHNPWCAAGGAQYVLELPLEQLRAALGQPADPDEQRPQRAIVPVSLGPLGGQHPGQSRHEAQALNWAAQSHSRVSPEEVC